MGKVGISVGAVTAGAVERARVRQQYKSFSRTAVEANLFSLIAYLQK